MGRGQEQPLSSSPCLYLRDQDTVFLSRLVTIFPRFPFLSHFHFVEHRVSSIQDFSHDLKRLLILFKTFIYHTWTQSNTLHFNF